MSKDPDGLTHVCERCRRNTELTHSRDLDEYLCDECISLPRCAKCSGFMKAPGIFHEPSEEFWCEDCVQNASEAAYERQCEDFHDGGSTSWPDAERKRLEEARKLK